MGICRFKFSEEIGKTLNKLARPRNTFGNEREPADERFATINVLALQREIEKVCSNGLMEISIISSVT